MSRYLDIEGKLLLAATFIHSVIELVTLYDLWSWIYTSAKDEQ